MRLGDTAGAADAWLALPLMSISVVPPKREWFRAMIRSNARVWRSPGGRPVATADSAAARIAALRLPLFVGLGSGDASGSHEVVSAIAQAHPAAIVREFEGAGHWLPIERPEAVGDSTLAFLQSVWCGTAPHRSLATCRPGSSTAPIGPLAEVTSVRWRGAPRHRDNFLRSPSHSLLGLP